MGATYLDAGGQSQVMEMGCYGIGITRVVAAAIEQNHDAKGIVWPQPLAPFAVAIAPVGYDRSEAVRALADRLHDELEAAGVEVLLDDRGERPGVMFADLELIGIPHRITIGDRGLKEGKVEYQARRGAPAADAGAGRATSAPSSEGSLRHDAFRHLRDAPPALPRPCAARCALAAGARRRAGRGAARAVGRRRACSARSPTSPVPADYANRAGPAALARRNVAAPRAEDRRTRARATNSSPPSTTKRRAPGSIRSSCSA